MSRRYFHLMKGGHVIGMNRRISDKRELDSDEGIDNDGGE
jgi:hypothetical protein